MIDVDDIPEVSYNSVPKSDKLHVSSKPFSSSVTVDPDSIVSDDLRQRTINLNLLYDEVFNHVIHRYNGFSGNIEGRVNMGSALPPQRKAQSPHYNHEKLVQLQEQFDILEESGVFCKPEEVGVVAEYKNLSFL